MNKLAKVFHTTLEAGISNTERALRQSAFLELYFKLREKSESSFLGSLTLEQRRCIHPFMYFINKAKNVVMGLRHKVLEDMRQQTDRPVIYAATHIGKFDIEILCEVIREHTYVLSGDYEHIQGTIDEAYLLANGVLLFNEWVKNDRAGIADRMIEILHQSVSLLYYPEGAWNLTPNLPVRPCYWGIIDVARKSNAIIRPVAIEQYGKHFDVIFGENFDVNDYVSITQGKTEAITALRDAMATLKWKIWENHPAKRSDILHNEWDNYRKARFKEWTYHSFDYVETLVYQPKGVTAPEEVWAHLGQLVPRRENAFLFNKRLGG